MRTHQLARSRSRVVGCALLVLACDRGGDESAAVSTPAKPPAQADRSEPKGAPRGEPGSQPAAAVPAAIDMKSLTVTTPHGWEGDYNAVLESWTFEKHTPADDGTHAPNRFYVDVLPDDAPRDVEAYAKGLQEDQNFQDSGYLFIDVQQQQADAGGWLIVGTSKDMSDDEDQGEPSFVMYRAAKNVYCRGGTFVDAKLRDEAIAGCRSI